MSIPDKSPPEYSAQHHADAFASVARAHAGMVFAACYRILGDAASAEDAAQECFLELARRTANAPERIGAWLHGVATKKALHAARTRKRRRYHEKQAQAVREKTDNNSTWAEIAPVVDKAIEELPPDMREVIVLYYLEEKTQSEIADHVGTSRQTIQRRIEDGIQTLRTRLKKSGMIVASATLSGMLTTQTAQAAPATLAGTIGKIAASGIGTQTSIASAVKGTVIGASVKKAIAITAIVATVAAGGIAIQKTIGSNEPAAPPPSAPPTPVASPKAENKPPSAPNLPFFQDLAQMDKWVQAEKDAGLIGPEEGTHIEVRELNMTKTLQVSFFAPGESVIKRLAEAGRYSKEDGILTIGETLLEGNLTFCDVTGKDIPFSIEGTAGNRGYLHINLSHVTMPQDTVKFIMSSEKDLETMQEHHNLWKEGKLWHLLSGNGSPNFLNYYKILLPQTAILVNASPRPIATSETNGRTTLTIRQRNFETGNNYHITFLWPEKDGSTLLDIPTEYREVKSNIVEGKE